jgi:5'-3' exonuclease
MKNKCTLIIDGNWLLMSRFAIMSDRFKLDVPETTKEAAQTELHELMAKSIIIVLNRFSCIDNVVLVSDGGSWRKQLPIPKSLEDTTYKGNRSHNVEHDWKYIYGALTDLSDHCASIGITVSHHFYIEGDDWAWYWSRRLNDENISCIIWTADNDLKQLVQSNPSTGVFTSWYNDRNGIWLHDDMEEKPMSDLDFFMQPIKVKSMLFEDLKQHSKSINFICPDNIVMEKIICGDAGDNIKSVAKTTKNNRTYKVSPKMWNEFKESLNIISIDDFISKKEDIANCIVQTKKFSECSTADILEMIDYNIKLVWLNENVIPETSVMYMNQIEYKNINLNNIKLNYKTLCKQNTEIEDIFNSIPF